MNDLIPLGPGAWAFISAYLLSLLGIGWLAKRARRADTLKDFYLAGNGFGFTVLFLTLFATQYSGNAFFAFTGATYRIGYAWITRRKWSGPVSWTLRPRCTCSKTPTRLLQRATTTGSF